MVEAVAVLVFCVVSEASVVFAALVEEVDSPDSVFGWVGAVSSSVVADVCEGDVRRSQRLGEPSPSSAVSAAGALPEVDDTLCVSVSVLVFAASSCALCAPGGGRGSAS